MEVTNAKELGNALKDNVDEIVIYDYFLMEKVLKIKSVNEDSWKVLIGFSAMGMLLLPASIPIIVAHLGLATTTAISIINYGGGFSALNKLREYQIIEQTSYKIVLGNNKPEEK